MDKVIKLENVNQYNELYGLETLHPLVSVIDLTKATKTVNHIQMNYGLYALFLKRARAVTLNMVVSIMITKKEPLSVLPQVRQPV